jgi:hypothetical protein
MQTAAQRVRDVAVDLATAEADLERALRVFLGITRDPRVLNAAAVLLNRETNASTSSCDLLHRARALVLAASHTSAYAKGSIANERRVLDS